MLERIDARTYLSRTLSLIGGGEPLCGDRWRQTWKAGRNSKPSTVTRVPSWRGGITRGCKHRTSVFCLRSWTQMPLRVRADDDTLFARAAVASRCVHFRCVACFPSWPKCSNRAKGKDEGRLVPERFFTELQNGVDWLPLALVSSFSYQLVIDSM